MSSNSNASNDTLHGVDVLDPEGGNWLIFQTRVLIAISHKGVLGHFDGSATEPPMPANPSALQIATHDAWLKKENFAKYLLSQKLHNETLTKHLHHTRVVDLWNAIVEEMTFMSMLGRSNLHTQFMQMRYKPGEDLPTEFNRVRTAYQNLITKGITVTNDDYRTLIINFVPSHLASYMSQISANAKVLAILQSAQAGTSASTAAQTSSISAVLGQTASTMASGLSSAQYELAPETMMLLLVEEWRRLKAIEEEKKRTKIRDTGVAASANPFASEKPGARAGGAKGNKGKGPKKPVGTCWNCGGKGHKQDACPSPKDDDSSSKGKGKGKARSKDSRSPTTNSTVANSAELDEIAGAWTTFAIDPLSDESASEVIYYMDDVLNFTEISWSSRRNVPSAIADLTDTGSESTGGSMPPLEENPDVPHPEPVHRVRINFEVGQCKPVEDRLPSKDDDDDDYPDGVPIITAADVERIELLKARLADVSNWRDAVEVTDDDFARNVDDDPMSCAAFSSSESDASTGQRIDLYDSGASHHMSPYRDSFVTFREITPRGLKAANQEEFSATGMGDVLIRVPNSPKPSVIRLTSVLYTPSIGFNLISIGRIDDAGYEARFKGGQCTILDPKEHVVGIIPKVSGLYRVGGQVMKVPMANAATTQLTLMEFHRRMGHIAPRAAKELVSKGLVQGVELIHTSESLECEACIKAKTTRKAVSKVREGPRATVFGGEVHSDLWGPARTVSLGKRVYYISFTDDFSRWTTLYLLRTKDQAFSAYKSFEAWVNNHRKVSILILHADRGGEYLDDDFSLHLEEHGTLQKLTVHDTPEDNGVSERLNRTLAEKMRAMLIASGLPAFLWGEAVLHAVWLKNRTSTKALDNCTPYEVVYKSKPDLSNVPEWGCKVWVHDTSAGKLGARAKVAYWVGFDMQSNGHHIYFPEKRTVKVERSVSFSQSNSSEIPIPVDDDGPWLEGEEWLPTKPDAPSSTPDETHSDEAPEPTPTTAPKPVPEPLRRSTRIRKPSIYVKDLLQGKGSVSNHPSERTSLPKGLQVPDEAPELETEGEGDAPATDKGEMVEDIAGMALAAKMADAEGWAPRNMQEASKRVDWPQWIEAIKYEINALEKHNSWRVVTPPTGAKIVGCRWVFDIKRNAAGEITRYRARLVAQGFSQVPGVNFFDTYAPVAKLASVRTVLAIANRRDMELEQVDIKSAYLYGKFASGEVIYMRYPPLPPGVELMLPKDMKVIFDAKGRTDAVLELLVPLYGLRQSARRFYTKLRTELKKRLRMEVCEVDQAVFFRVEGTELIIIVAHVDDLTIATSSPKLMLEVKSELCKAFEVSDLGALSWILGIKVKRDRINQTISLSQPTYIRTIVEKYFGTDLKPLSMPMDPHANLTNSQSPQTPQEAAVMRDKPYREAVGSLMYASLGTRPDIAYAVSIVSRFSDNPGIAHWNAVKRIYQYLAGTADLALTFGHKPRELEGYSDADGSMHEDRHAISGYAFMIDGGAVSWSSKQQEIIALSTTEAEYVAQTHAAKEALWLRSLIGQIFGGLEKPTTLYADNQSAIALAQDQQYHARTKHIDIRYHFIRWIIAEGKIKLVYCPTAEMVADTLTKALPSPKVKHFASALGLRKD